MRHAEKAEWVLALLLMSLPVMAQEPAQPANPQNATTPAPTAQLPDIPENQAEIEAMASGQFVLEPSPGVTAMPPARSPEMTEIDEALAVERALVTDLEALLRNATDETGSLALLREIEQTKYGAELTILRIQAKHARLAGRETQAQEIEAAVAQIENPSLAPTVAPTSPSGDAGR
jgi:hypothetical protein